MVKLTEEQRAAMKALADMPDEDIDLSDIPEWEIDWSTVKIGMGYKPDWQEVTLRLDQNLVDWLEERAGSTEQAHLEINRALMKYIWDIRFPNRKFPDPENSGAVSNREQQTRH